MAVFDASDDLITPYSHEGGVPFGATITIPTTALDSNDEQTLLFKFPDVAYLQNRAGAVSYETGALDSGTPALVAVLGIGDVDGVIDSALTGNIDEGDTGDSVQLASAGGWIDVGGKYIIFDVTTAAATPAAATVEVAGVFYVNVNEQTATADAV